MFSAIVAVILIMTGVVLTNILVTTEEKTSRQIYSMLNNYQLADAANIARADALQTFNYAFREKLEDYLTFDASELANDPGFAVFVVKGPNQKYKFDDMKKTFEEVILGTASSTPTTSSNAALEQAKKFDAAIRYISEKTIDQFKEGSYGRFSVYLSSNNQSAKDDLTNVVRNSLQGKKGFLEVVGCSDIDCPLGTFYFNIPLNDLTDQEYEKLPRIIVKDIVTKEEIKMAILPKTNLKIYIPLRFFKALSEAKILAESISNGSHADLANYRLGFCDASCKPNTNPTVVASASLVSYGKNCPDTETGSEVKMASAILNVDTYLAGGTSAGIRGLKLYGAQNICERAKENQVFVQKDSTNTFGVLNTELPSDSQNDRPFPYPECGLNRLIIAAYPEANFRVKDSLGGGYLRCGRINAVYADIVYKETNQKYLVRGTYDGGNADLYKIRVEDTGFDPIQTDTDRAAQGLIGECSSGSGECRPVS